MCIAIYIALVGLFVIYSDYMIEQYALTVNAGTQDAMVVAAGWEMVLWLWPVVVAAMLMASAVTFGVLRRCRCCATTRVGAQSSGR
jgi:hypothetical protein